MRAVLRTLSSAPELPGTAAPVDADAASRLRSLGYVGRAAPLNAHPSAADDPKRLVALNERFNSALTAFDERRADVALSEFVAILRERPDFLSARTSAATILLNSGRGNDAVRLLEEAPSSQHASAEWSIRLGAALREVGRMREAATVLEAARNAGADDVELTQNLATVYAALGRASEARALFESLAAVEGAPATAWYNLGLVELQSGRKQRGCRRVPARRRTGSVVRRCMERPRCVTRRTRCRRSHRGVAKCRKTVAARLRSAVQRRHADRRPSPGERSGSLSAAVRRGGATASIRTGHRSRRAAIEGDREPFEMTASPGRLAFIALSLLIAGCNRIPVPEKSTSGAGRGYNLLLVTIDTLRADRVGSYGSSLGLTPTLDGLAREGVRFAVARAHVPLTLPSHATIFTGRYPPGTGVHDNGAAPLAASIPTLATVLKSSGYQTAAFVGAFVLDARFGLNRGFDVYDDRMMGNSATLEVVQRTAEQVLAPAADWILTGRSSLVARSSSLAVARTARRSPLGTSGARHRSHPAPPHPAPPHPAPPHPAPHPTPRHQHPALSTQHPAPEAEARPGSPGSTSTTRTNHTTRPNRTARGTPRIRMPARSLMRTRRLDRSWRRFAPGTPSTARSSSSRRTTVKL